MTNQERDKIRSETLHQYFESREDVAFAEVRLQIIGDKLKTFGEALTAYANTGDGDPMVAYDPEFINLQDYIKEAQTLRNRFVEWKHRLERLVGPLDVWLGTVKL